MAGDDEEGVGAGVGGDLLEDLNGGEGVEVDLVVQRLDLASLDLA